jgi:twitching motility protein PilT
MSAQFEDAPQPLNASTDGPAQAPAEAPVQAPPVAGPGSGQTSVVAKAPEPQVLIPDLLDIVLQRGASDLHLTSGSAPVLRLLGDLVRLDDYPVLTPQSLRTMIYAIISQRQREKLEQDLELDLSYSVPGKARFRVNVYFQRDSVGAAFRLIPFEIKHLDDLGIPPVVAEFARLPRGFILVTGPTGSGKSTTLASLVDIVNVERSCHIMTVEDPIEFLHRHKRSMVNQREIGADTHSFSEALKHVLRQDPDVILVGEMRDLETISTAITAAETGHLVFATLHTQDAPQTIDRIIDVFPPHQQQQIRVQLSTTLQGVVTQQLLQTADGRGRVAATEVLIATPAVRHLIREGKVHQVYSVMQAGGRFGMQTMDASLARLVKSGQLSHEMAVERSHDPEELNRLLRSADGMMAGTGAGMNVKGYDVG